MLTHVCVDAEPSSGAEASRCAWVPQVHSLRTAVSGTTASKVEKEGEAPGKPRISCSSCFLLSCVFWCRDKSPLGRS